MEPGSRWLTFMTTLLASLVAAIAIVLVSGWGGDDVGVFFFWTIPFAALLTLPTRSLARLLPQARGAALIAAVLGAAAGLLWAIAVALILGPFVLAFGFAIWLAWAAGGAAGLVAGTSRISESSLRRVRRITYAALALATVPYIALAVYVWLFAPGPDVVAKLQPGTTDARARAFIWNTVMNETAVESVTQNDPLVLEIDLTDDATTAQRADLLETLRGSPLVERVETDT